MHLEGRLVLSVAPTNGLICRVAQYPVAPTNRIWRLNIEPPLQKDAEYLKWSIKIWIFSNDLGWRNDQNKSCRSRKVLKFEFFKPRMDKQQKQKL
jgi:hypothetical protein